MSEVITRGSKETDGDERRPQLTEDVKYWTTCVELHRRDPESGLGIIVIGGADTNEHPSISQIRAGSPADRSDALEPGDLLVAVNGQPTARLPHADIINLLKHAGPHLRLEIKFPLPPKPSSRSCYQKETSIVVQKEGDGFGLTIRGGPRPGESGRAPYVITRIRPGSPADRDGLFRPGDRITAIDGVSLEGMPHGQMINLLRKAPLNARFTVQYDVQIFDAVLHANGPLSVEIDKAGARMGTGKPLGMNIIPSHNGNRSLVIESILPASIADRCGALNAGDRLDNIDGTECSTMNVAEAIQLLESTDSSVVNMQVTPTAVLKAEQQAQSTVGPQGSYPIISRNLNGDAATSDFSAKTAPRNHSPPPLPRPPAVLYTQPLREPPSELPHQVYRELIVPQPLITRSTEHNFLAGEHRYTPTRPSEIGSTPNRPTENGHYQANRSGGPVHQQSHSSRPPEIIYPHAKKDADDGSDDGSLYEKSSSNDDTDGISFLVCIEKRSNESWGISLAYKRRDALSEIVVHNIETGGIANRTEALRVGDIISQINAKSMRNQSLQEAYLQLACDYVTLKIVRKTDHRLAEARHSPAESANSNASVDSAVESWESNLRPQPRNAFNGHRSHKALPHSVSAHHIAEVETVSLHMRGSESIPERLDHATKPAYRDAENLKNSIEMMDQILTLNDSWTERRTVPTKTAPSYNNSPSTHLPTKNYDQTFVLDSLLEDLATMRNQKALPQRPPQERLHQAPVIRRVKFQTPNGTLVPPMHYNTLNGKSSTFEVALAKDPYYEDFGFSLSDGAFERGVYVNRVRPSGPAENIGLKPCDQILKVNKTDVSHLDCCLAVPLIAAAGDQIHLVISRRTLNRRIIKGDESDEPSRDREIDVLESDML